MKDLKPSTIVAELDKYIIGQEKAKRAIAIAIRNRWRRQRIKGDIAREIYPKNIIMIGPTGVGKTEIARRMAGLIDAPFIKVEATKFTEVGYHGGDVSSIIRSLVKIAVNQLENREKAETAEAARKNAVERVLDILLPPRPAVRVSIDSPEAEEGTPREEEIESNEKAREKLRRRLEAGKLDEKEVEIELEVSVTPMIEVFSGPGMEEMGLEIQSMFEHIGPKTRKTKRVTVKEAMRIFMQEESEKLINRERIVSRAVEMVETSGIVFIDEIDKIARREDSHRDIDVSREGVQRDLLPLLDGTTIATRYGNVKTDYILFIAAGAFHTAKPSDLMPELQGRFPIRVELDPLGKEDFVRILTEPHNALLKQYRALLETEGVEIEFTRDAVERLADIAFEVNARTVNIGARRLYTIVERMIEDISFHAPDMRGNRIKIDAKMVDEQLSSIARDEDLSRYIL